MRVHLDSEKCQGHGQCELVAPGLFGFDDQGFAVLMGDAGSSDAASGGVATSVCEVPESLGEAATSAESRCPERAITTTAD